MRDYGAWNRNLERHLQRATKWVRQKNWYDGIYSWTGIKKVEKEAWIRFVKMQDNLRCIRRLWKMQIRRGDDWPPNET